MKIVFFASNTRDIRMAQCSKHLVNTAKDTKHFEWSENYGFVQNDFYMIFLHKYKCQPLSLSFLSFFSFVQI